jgi:DHA2 family multidrug resistance protein-like MFS transporter
MLPFDLFRIPLFALSVWTSICSYAAQILAYVSLPFLFETGLHLSAVQTGLLLTPWPFMTAITAPISGRLIVRYPAAVICSIGLALLAAGLLLMVFLPTTPSKWDVVWRLALCGIGFGLFQTPNNTAMMTAGPIRRSGAASGMNASARYVGWSLGSALVALIFGLGGDHGAAFCLVAGMGFALMGAAISSARRFRWS